MHLAHVALLINDYDVAIDWLSRCLDFRVHEDTATEGKRWVTMTPSGGGCIFVLSRVKNVAQSSGVGKQFAGRVGFFLHTECFDRAEDRLRQNQVQIIREPEDQPHGRVLVFQDLWGNWWDLIQPVPRA